MDIDRTSGHIDRDMPAVERYQNVNISGNATAIVGDVCNFHNYQNTQAEDHGSGVLKSFLDQLAYPDMQSRFQMLNDPYPDTFKWILSSRNDNEVASNEAPVDRKDACWDSFTNWLRNGSTPYWISGKLGTGKSTLMKYVVESLSRSQKSYGETEDIIVISHFFWAPGSQLQNSVVGCLRTLLWQLLRLGNGRCNETRFINLANLGSVTRLRDCLIKTIQAFDKKVVLLLDGLDECREIEDTLDLVEALVASPHVKLCVSSRREEVFVLHFSEFARLKLQDLNNGDISHFVRTELLGNPRVRRSPSWNARIAQDLADSIIKHAEGVFLWVRLVIKELFRGWTNRDDLLRMRKRLEKLPQDIYDLYTELLRRNEEDSADYAGEATTYYHLLAQSQGHRLSLVAFFFATNQTVRARYLEVDKVFKDPLTELEQDVDLEDLVTWINVRTAGLLEVKKDDSIFVFNNRNRPGPTGKFLPFQNQWVGFLHRSAYSYLQDSADGQNLMRELPMTLDALKDTYFESQVATTLILPGTYNFRFLYDCRGFRGLFPVQTVTSNSLRKWCKLLQKVFNSLAANSLIITIIDWSWITHDEQYPTSDYAAVDLAKVSAEAFGALEIAQTFVHQYDCQDDEDYMSGVRLACLISHFWSGELADDKDCVPSLLKNLVGDMTAISKIRVTPSLERYAFALRLAEIAGRVNDHIRTSPILQFLRANVPEEFPLLIPTAKLLFNHLVFRRPSSPPTTMFAILSIGTLEAWIEGHDLGGYSANGRALFYVDRSSEHRNIFGVFKSNDSSHVLERLRSRIVPPHKRGDSSSDVVGDYSWQYGVCFGLGAAYEVMLSMGFGEYFDRSIHCDSFVDCLRHIGKKEETLDYVVEEQVQIAEHCDWDFYHNRHTFHDLLGSDPQVLASWVQKYPALGNCPGIMDL